VVTIQFEVSWVVTPCCAGGGSTNLWNDGNLPQHYTASRSRRHGLVLWWLFCAHARTSIATTLYKL